MKKSLSVFCVMILAVVFACGAAFAEGPSVERIQYNNNGSVLIRFAEQIARSAGQVATLRGKEESYAQIKLPSGEVRMIHVNCHAMVGQIGNLDQMNVKMGKAGKKRYLGFRPHVRGVAMNPVDHPMGGGEGRTSGGGHPVSPWGKLAKGKRTRSPKKTSKNFIVERRKK